MIAITIAVISAIGAIIGAVLTYRASAKQTVVDKDTSRIDQVMNGMQKIIDNLTAENQRLSTELINMRAELNEVRKSLNESEKARQDAVYKLDRLMDRHDRLAKKLENQHVIEDAGEV